MFSALFRIASRTMRTTEQVDILFTRHDHSMVTLNVQVLGDSSPYRLLLRWQYEDKKGSKIS